MLKAILGFSFACCAVTLTTNGDDVTKLIKDRADDICDNYMGTHNAKIAASKGEQGMRFFKG